MEIIAIFKNSAYICAIAFQLAAAWLLVGNTAVKRSGIIKAYCAEHKGGIPFDEKGKLLDCSAWEATVKSAWINRMAFFFLGIGYLLNIFGECTLRKEYAVIVVLSLTIVLVVIPTNAAKKKSKETMPPCLDEVPLVDGVQIMVVADEEYQKNDILR